MSGRGPVSAALRIDNQNPGHTTLAVFIGRTVGARGHSGTLTVRTDELDHLGITTPDGKLAVEFEWLEPLNGQATP